MSRRIIAFDSFDIGDGDGGLHRTVLALCDDGTLWQFDNQWEQIPPVPARPSPIKRIVRWFK
jgi:hypothetical protein